MNLYDVFDLCTDKMVIHNGKTEDIVEQLQVTKHMFYHSVSRDVPMRKRYQIIKTREKICLAGKRTAEARVRKELDSIL